MTLFHEAIEQAKRWIVKATTQEGRFVRGSIAEASNWLEDAIKAHDRRVTELLEANNREVERRRNLREALGFALHRLIQWEPGDSRAVSNEFVAMAAIEADVKIDGSHEINLSILREALARETVNSEKI